MHPSLYQAARSGDVYYLMKTSEPLDSTTPQGNTTLHIAARLGHVNFIKALLGQSDRLLTRTNKDGENPLHVAAKAGHVHVADAMMTHLERWPADPETDEGGVTVITQAKNEEGNTPLHEAVRAGREVVALKLLEWDMVVADEVNREGETPLHLAARGGMYNVVNAMLDVVVPPVLTEASTLQGMHTPLHEAVKGDHAEVVELLIEKRKDMIAAADTTGRTALHYAAQKDNGQIVEMLLTHDPSLAYTPNFEGSPPLHIAAAFNSKSAITKLLKCCPDAAEQLDKHKMTVLHVAIIHGSLRALRTLLKMIELDEIVNKGDEDLNTPLHVAAKNSRIQSMMVLLEDKRVEVRHLNKDGETARDIIESYTDQIDPYLVYIRKALKKREAGLNRERQNPSKETWPSTRKKKMSAVDEQFKSSAETYTLVAALIATVTFAAIFTMPGGYSQNDGTAIRTKHAAFKVFVLSNTVATCTSLVVVFCFIWAWKDPVMFKLSRLVWGHRLTVVACLAMLVSLMMAVFVVVAEQCLWLAVAVILICLAAPVVVCAILGWDVVFVPYPN
ncbi:hypothetical protein QJS10_CPB21g00257 [Acorus calamus]|uniref:PGG domain-containing protein n=1 Tax=Acorus calamus TaxID=4465 RepID=A0AAV9C7I2_ACOCL|nr:hypothetical protein QJS10_CPB21g00257 [Acorus calamus]